MTRRSDQEQNALDLNFEIRRVLNNAFHFIQGQQFTQGAGAVTYEELADQQIERIEGRGTSTRPNEFDRIARMESQLLAVVDQIKQIPPENLLLKDGIRDVNTPEELEDG